LLWPVRLEHCEGDECSLLRLFAEGTKLAQFSVAPDADWALQWYATAERESVLDIYDLERGRLACSVDIGGHLGRPASLAWAKRAIIYSRSAGTHLDEVDIWSLACAKIDSLGAAQVFVAEDLEHAIEVRYEPGKPYWLELVDLPQHTHARIGELDEHGSVESVAWAPHAVEVVIAPGEQRLRVPLR
jgi:hypothetical protein